MEKNLNKQKVSVIIPSYNSEETIADCLKSIYSQTYPCYEVIVVDGFSGDHTVEIATKFGSKIVQKEGNQAQARNMGVINSSGKYLLFVDSDQILSPAVIEECVRKCENEDVGMVRVLEIFIGKNFWTTCSAVWKNYYEKVGRSYNKSENIIRGEPRFFIKEQVGRVGMLDAALVWGENYHLYQKLLTIGVKVGLCRSVIYHYELGSLRQIVVKNLRYAKSMPTFAKQTEMQLIQVLPKQAMLTFREVLINVKSPKVIAGCTTLLFFKTYSAVIGILTGLRQS
jgi:glycosyltransferase involved in cell wall biosynthesis